MSAKDSVLERSDKAAATKAPYTTKTAIIGFAVQVLRKEMGFTQSSLAAATRISQATISRIELGEADVTATQMYAICEALGSSPTKIFSLADAIGSSIRAENVEVLNRAPRTAAIESSIAKSDASIATSEMVPFMSIVNPVGFAIASIALGIIKDSAKK